MPDGSYRALFSDRQSGHWIERVNAPPDFLVEDAMAQAEPQGLTPAETQASGDRGSGHR